MWIDVITVLEDSGMRAIPMRWVLQGLEYKTGDSRWTRISCRLMPVGDAQPVMTYGSKEGHTYRPPRPGN